MKTNGHKWAFFRAAGVEQVVLRNGADLLHLEDLDLKLWVALACPTKGLEFDARTLELLDSDGDGRIRVPEILAALRWCGEVFADPDDLLKGGDSVPLDSISTETETGRAVLFGAKRILANLGKADADAVELGDVSDTARIFASTRFNGDGVVPPEAADDANVRKAIDDVIACVGSTVDRSGKAGVDTALVERFFDETKSFAEWSAKPREDASILPLKDKTASAAAAFAVVRAKVDDYFTRCALAAFDARAAEALQQGPAEYASMASKELSLALPEIAALPLATIEAGKALPLDDGLNPAWSSAVASFAKNAIEPLVGKGKQSLTEPEWKKVCDALAPWFAWQASKPPTSVEKLGAERASTLASSGAKEKILVLIEQDTALEEENRQVGSVERLVRYRRDLHKLLCNFVNFSEFFATKQSVFQAGTLFLDGRSCDLCFRVDDAAKHAALAGLAKTYLAYCDCVRPSGAKMTIAAAFTGGDSDNLLVGRNGLFYDRKGRDWDATITKVIENPISVRESFFKPYKTFVRMIEEQVAKRASTAEQASTAKLETTASTVATADQAAVAKPAPKQIDIGTVAAIGIAFGAIGTFLSTIFAAFLGLGFWIPLGFLALVFAISGPSMLIAWLKLRQRNLGPILDASGWAVNGRVKINVPFGGALTALPHLPPGSERRLTDPYAVKKSPWPRILFALAVILAVLGVWFFGKVDRWLPEPVRSTTLLGEHAPANRAAATSDSATPNAPVEATPPTGN